MGPLLLPWAEREPLLAALQALVPGFGQAEHESNDPDVLLRYFLPTPSFQRALDPNAMLIIGERGAGKTELFRVLGTRRGLETLGIHRPGETLEVIAGYGRVLQQQTDQPDAGSVSRRFAGASDADWRAFWLGMLAARLLREGAPLALPRHVEEPLREPARLDIWLPPVLQAFDAVIAALDGLDTRLRESGRTIVVAYDELDRIVPSYPGLFPPIRVLLAFWLEGWRRWQRLRPKIILRTDLWESRLLAFPDASKLGAHRVELEWRRQWLYRMCVKRTLNGPAGLADFVRRAAAGCGHSLREDQDPVLGAVPAMDEEAFAAVVTALVGQYMGANPRKGRSYDWIPNHVTDAQGRVLPRPFLQLFALAARSAHERAASPDGIGPLLTPLDFSAGLSETSEHRLRELEEQRAWMEPLRHVFKEGLLPMERAEVIARLRSIAWPEGVDERSPPTTDAERLLDDYLVKMGIFEVRPDGRLNVPDIYRNGLQMRRRGGITSSLA